MSYSSEVRITLRLPSDLRDRVATSAERNGRSMNAEIVARLAESMQWEERDGIFKIYLPQDLLDRVLHKANEAEIDPNLLIIDAVEEKYPPDAPTFGQMVNMIRKQLETEPPDSQDEKTEIEEYLRAAEALLKLKPHFGKPLGYAFQHG